MKRFFLLLLCAALVLTGCAGGATNALGLHGIVSFDEMTYEHPDMDAIADQIADCCQTVQESEDLDTVLDAVWTYYETYDLFYDCYNLAYVHYNADMTDYYWQQEYEYCAGAAADVEAGLEELYTALAQSPIRDELESEEYFGAGYFDAYEGDGMWDEGYLALYDRETALVNEYYNLYAQAMDSELYTTAWYDEWAQPLCENYVELVKVRQELAAYCGYDSYMDYAYDYIYYRDYTWQEADTYLQQLRQELVPVYLEMADTDIWDLSYQSCPVAESYDFLRNCADAMGGTIAEAFQLLDEAKLYDIEYGSNKNNISFELYFYTYYQPFVFVSPGLTQYDKLTLVHEFGHFANDYASAGSYAGIDVAEIFSQGMEYLSLCYGQDTQDLAKLKMADSLCTYVEQAAYAAFEHRVYALAGDELTTENVFALYAEIFYDYGMDVWDWDERCFVDISHLFTDPMYVISYVVSNDAAMQLYQLEQSDPGAGLALYQEHLDTTEYTLLSFVDSAGLESPFGPHRLTAVRQTMEQFFGS